MTSTQLIRPRSPMLRAWIAVLLASAAPLCADVKLASPFTSQMVLQRELPVPVWGWADAGESVTVEFAGQTKTCTADADGNWKVTLDPLTASAERQELIARGSKTAHPLALNDVLVGEVWLASGQSNMAFTVSKSVESWAGMADEAKEIAAADHPQIRMFRADPVRADKPQTTVPGKWEICSPQTVPAFSAVGYTFALALNRELNIPVGIVVLSYGSSTAQSWISREAISAEPKLKPELDRFDETLAKYVPPSDTELETWRAAVEKAKADNTRPPRQPKPSPVQDQHNPTVLFNGVVAPVVPFAARGIIWYQGESITTPTNLFPLWNQTLIADWRKRWGRDLPFYFCQLAALDKRSNSPEVRAMQAEALKEPNTAMVVTVDIGDRSNVHPKNKVAVGERLARVALARDYGRKIEYVGPTFAGATAQPGAVRLTFSHADGLTARGGAPKTFEVAAADGKFVPAEATIDGASVIVWSPAVATPTSVRYAWANYPDGANLYNAAGLPGVPFRADVSK